MPYSSSASPVRVITVNKYNKNSFETSGDILDKTLNATNIYTPTIHNSKSNIKNNIALKNTNNTHKKNMEIVKNVEPSNFFCVSF